MGMILIFFWGLYVAAAVGIYLFIKHYINMKWVNRITLAILILVPTYDIIITNALGFYYCKAEPNPKTFIKKKVQYPESIYWEDNVYQGFNAEDRKRMIQKYLDDIHLKTMALNGDDGKIYVYRYENIPQEYYGLKKEYSELSKEATKCQNDWDVAYASNDLKYKEIGEKCFVLRKQQDELENQIDKTVKTFTLKEEKHEDKSTMPKMNYTVTFDEVKLNPLSRKFLYSDETKVVDNTTNEVIAYNRRYMRFFYNIMPDLSLGNLYYDPWDGLMCGSKYLYYDGDNFKYIAAYCSAEHVDGLNRKLYNRYIKGE